MKNFYKNINVILVIVITCSFSLAFAQTSQKLTQTNGPIGGKFKQVLAFNKGWKYIDAGFDHSIAINFDGSLWSWGKNDVGQLGDNTLISKSKPTQIDTNKYWQLVKTGGNHTLALQFNPYPKDLNGQDKFVGVYSWGWNGYGQLGLAYPPENKKTLTRITYFDNVLKYAQVDDLKKIRIALGAEHSILLDHTGKIYVWGNGNKGQLGIDLGNATLSYNILELNGNEWKEVAAGDYHNLAIKTDGTLWAWGSNDKGQLGDSTKINRIIPVQIGKDKDWKFISCGTDHSIAIKTDGSIWGWGSNNYYQLGDSTSNQLQLNPKKLNKEKWVYVDCGVYFTVAQNENGKYYSWGANHKGQLGDGSTYYRNIPVIIQNQDNYNKIVAGGNYALGLEKNGELLAWGDNSNGKLGITKEFDSIPNFVDKGNTIVYALPNSSSNNNIFKSTDNGNIWEALAISKIENNSSYSNQGVILKQEFDKLILGEKSRILKSTNLANNWEVDGNSLAPVSSLNYFDINKKIRIASDSRYTVLSTNSGQSYMEIYYNSWNRNGEVVALNNDDGSIQLFNGTSMFGKNSNKLGYSNDSGKTWKGIDYIQELKQTPYPSNFSKIYPSKDRKSFLAGTNESFGSNYLFERDKFENIYLLGYINAKINDIIFKDTTYIGTDKGIKIYSKKAGGIPYNYAQFRTISDTNLNINVSCFNYNENDGILYTATNGQGIIRNKSFNSSWEQLNLKNQKILSFVSLGNTLFTVADQGGIFSTNDAGNTWKSNNVGIETFDNLSKLNVLKDKIYLNSYYQVFTLLNDKWIVYQDKRLDSAKFGSGIILDSKFDNNYDYYFIGDYSVSNKNVIEMQELVRKNKINNIIERLSIPTKEYINTFLYNNNLYYAGNGELFKSLNQGNLWTKLIYINNIANIDINENSIVAVTSEKGDSTIKVSTNEGINWQNIGKGFPAFWSTPIVKIVGSAIYAVVNNELWYSPISNPKWRKYADSSNYNITQIHNHNGTLFVGTEFNSVWKIQLSPILISPADSSNQIELNPRYIWNSLQGAKEYEFQLSDTSDFVTNIYNLKTNDTTLLPNLTLNKASRYFWRVRVKNSEDIWSSWSYVNVFATKFPEMSILYSPASNALNRSAVQAFALIDNDKKPFWKYQVQFASDKNFNDIKINKLYDSVFFYIEISKGTSYFYRVRQFDPQIGFGGEWLPTSNDNYINTAQDQIYFSPIRDGFKFTNDPFTMWQPEHYNQFDYSIYPSIGGTPRSTFPSYHDFSAAFGWQEKYIQCCCKRKYLFGLLGPKVCETVFQWNTLTKWGAYVAANDGGKWGGSCFGFSVLALQNFMIGGSQNNINLQFNDSIQRKINQRQEYYATKTAQQLRRHISPNSLADYLRKIFSSENKRNYPELSFFEVSWGGHSVVPYMVTSGVSLGRNVDTIWVYNNWNGFDVHDPKVINHIIIIDKASNTWKNCFFNTSLNDFSIVVSGNENFQLNNVGSYPVTPELIINHKVNEISNSKKRGDFFLANDSSSNTSIYVSNNKNTTIIDQDGRKLILDSISQSEIPNVFQLLNFGGLKDNPNLKIFGAMILPSDSMSKYTIEKTSLTLTDTNNVKVFALGYNADISWNAKSIDKPFVITVSDSSNGIQVKSKAVTEQVSIEVYKEDLIKGYQKSIKIKNTSLAQEEDFKAGFSSDASEFVITNDGKNKKYDVTVDLGVEIDLKNIAFDSKDTHIYKFMEPKDDNDTTKLILTIVRSASGKKDTTITFNGSLDSTTSVAEWYNKSNISSLKMELFPNPVIDNINVKLEIPNLSFVKLEVFDLNGRLLKNIINGERESGTYYISTDLSELPSEIYLLKLTINNTETVKQFVIQK